MEAFRYIYEKQGNILLKIVGMATIISLNTHILLCVITIQCLYYRWLDLVSS